MKIQFFRKLRKLSSDKQLCITIPVSKETEAFSADDSVIVTIEHATMDECGRFDSKAHKLLNNIQNFMDNNKLTEINVRQRKV